MPRPERKAMTTTRRGRLKVAALGAAAVVATASLAACGSSSSGSGSSASGSASEVQAALKKGGNLTVWAWEPTLKPVVKQFEAKYPKVHVKLVNAGTGNDQYTAL